MNWKLRYASEKYWPKLPYMGFPERGAGPHDPGFLRLHEVYPHMKEYLSGIEGEEDDGPGGDINTAKRALEIAKNVYNKPDSLVTIYREVPKGANSINPWDWVSFASRRNEKGELLSPSHGRPVGPGLHVIRKAVPASHVYTFLNADAPDMIEHAGYHPPFPQEGK